MQTTGAIRPTHTGSGPEPGSKSDPHQTRKRVTSFRSDSSPGLEASLYPPVKQFLEGLGYAVKGEIGSCDLVGLGQDGTVVVIGELKLRFNLDLLLQAVDRMPACDEVWLAVRAAGRNGRERDPRVRKLCRLLGFGLLGVTQAGQVEIVVPCGPWRPRRDPRRRSRLVEEHQRRQGDPACGGSAKMPIMTAYRQQALACAAALSRRPSRPRDLKGSIPDAPKILLRNVYGWFVRQERGLYALSEQGRAALGRWPPDDTNIEWGGEHEAEPLQRDLVQAPG
jgi:hypothetical protein